VLDLGAGTGSLTAHLLDAGARVIAVELHPRRAERLRRRFGSDGVAVVQRDLATFRWPRRPFRVVANPPYAGSNRLLRDLLSAGASLTAADLVLQRGTALGLRERAARWARGVDLSLGLDLPPDAFRPRPPVASAVLVVRPRRTSPRHHRR
jgi:23S rRNA (adenine-N6)-dimethyltransferase